MDAGARLFYLADANHNVTGIVGLVETEPDVFEWQVVERYVYSPYGAVTIYTPDWSATRAESAFDNTTLYTGREFDSETGLYYYRARYYHAELGQFISRDPIGYEAGDVNLYRYVGNDPLARVDPSGLTDSPLGPTSDVVVGTLAGQQVSVAARFVTTIGGDRYYYTLNSAKQLNPVTTDTSTFFIYKGTDRGANNVFRLDFHRLAGKGRQSAWHTNVGGQFRQLTRLDHATSPRITAAGRTITIFKRAGKPLFVLGVAASAVDVYYAEDRPREITKKVSGFGAAWLGAKGGAWGGAKIGAGIAGVAGQFGPQVAAPEEIVTVPVGGILGGVVGGIIGGGVGFWTGETVTEYVWDTWLFPLEKEEWIVCEPPI